VSCLKTVSASCGRDTRRAVSAWSHRTSGRSGRSPGLRNSPTRWPGWAMPTAVRCSSGIGTLLGLGRIDNGGRYGAEVDPEPLASLRVHIEARVMLVHLWRQDLRTAEPAIQYLHDVVDHFGRASMSLVLSHRDCYRQSDHRA